MNISDIPERIGYRGFDCDECGYTYTLLTRDRHSPSGDECPNCNSTNHPRRKWKLDEIVDAMSRHDKQAFADGARYAGEVKKDAEWLAAVDEISQEYILTSHEREFESCLVSEFVNELKTRMEATK